MKNKIRFEDLTHLILLFLLFLVFTTTFLSMKNGAQIESDKLNQVIDLTGISSINFDENLKLQLGKKLFKANCGSCHASDMITDLTGPGLGGVAARWEKNDIYSWVRNSQKYLIENPEHKYIQMLAKKNTSIMTAFPNLKDEEIENILSYIDAIYTP